MPAEIQPLAAMPINLRQQKQFTVPSSGNARQKMSLDELKEQLAITQQRLNAAEQEISKLTRSNKLFRQKLIRLVKMYKQARHFAYHDKLTGLPNRSLLIDRLRQVMARSARQKKHLALLFIDLDKFKEVNDRFRHLTGDQLLKQVAERLATCVRAGDTVCRYGGDEFVIMLTDIDSKAGVAEAVAKMRDRLSVPYQLEGHRVQLSVSIGFAIYQAEGQSHDDFIKQADRAMYVAKAANRFNYSST